MGGRKSVFEYDDFREYLKDSYESAKSQDAKYSFRFFSRIVGSKSPSFFKHVIEGQRNLTSEHVDNLIRGLKMNEEEGFFFRNLVNLNQSKTVEEKQKYISKILQSKAYRKLHPLSLAQYEFFTRWYCVPIREMVALPGFREDPKWIAKHLNFPVSEPQIETAINEMIQLGLLSRNERGHLVQTQAHVTTEDRIISSSLAKSHQELIKKGSESIDRIPREDREILGITFAFPQSSMEKVKEKILNFRREIVELLSAEPNADAIYQFHLLLFPLAQLDKKKAGEK